jgi:TRAP-type C4-dicarboxylate transport system substrate-binding protein
MKPGDEQDIARKRFDRLSKDDQTKLLQIAKMVYDEKKKANTKDIEEQNLSEEGKIRKKYDGMERPSQDEVNDTFEKFEREAHYLNNKPVGDGMQQICQIGNQFYVKAVNYS